MPTPLTCCASASNVDLSLATEVNFGVKLADLCKLHLTAHNESLLSLESAKQWGLSDEYGVYLLWRKTGACASHAASHCMEAMYVGKGYPRWRIVKHWKQKRMDPLLPIYFSFTCMSNRKAKYVERLLLDEHSFALNKFENVGATPLIACCKVDP